LQSGRYRNLESVLQFLVGTQANTQADVVTAVTTNRVDHFEQEPDALLDRATVGVRALVRRRGKKLRDEVAVRGVDIDPVIACQLQVPRGLAECVDDRVDVLLGHFPRGVGIPW
jgi:hypothetical protein